MVSNFFVPQHNLSISYYDADLCRNNNISFFKSKLFKRLNRLYFLKFAYMFGGFRRLKLFRNAIKVLKSGRLYFKKPIIYDYKKP